MAESVSNPVSIAREAKALTQSLKESLKNHEPWEREIEFQRTSLRKQFLQLLFLHPYAKESKEADHTLWLTTSYFIISAYKQRIAAADAVIHQTSSDYHGHHRGHERHHGKQAGVLEHRKLVHRFRQFLAEEEKFWTSFVVRAVRVFGLDEAQSALVALNINIGEANGNGSPGISPSTRNDRRNIFPGETDIAPPSPGQKEQKMIMLSKALVCLGDIARYREHYNEGGGRPRAGKDFHDEARQSGRGRGGRRAVEQPPRPRNYSKAQECYERAHLLVPDVGNACHQLAILASYQQDPFAGILQYYRAICVKQPYETATSNLDSTLSRNLENYKNTVAKSEPNASEAPKLKVERFKKSLVALHGLWKLSAVEAEKQLPCHADTVNKLFSELVSDRVLPTDIVWKTLIMGLGALWRFRVLRDPTTKRDPKRAISTEARILSHILRLMQTLFRIGSEQLTEVRNSPEPSVNGTPVAPGEVHPDLAQDITAVFRRTLPALRIGSKWLMMQYSYITEARSRLESDKFVDIRTVLREFWESYNYFGTQLAKTFPVERLPKVTQPLEEDIEVSGFTPLKQATPDPCSTVTGFEPGQSQVHPNEEQLMRIADLLTDRQKYLGFKAQGSSVEGRPTVVDQQSPKLASSSVVGVGTIKTEPLPKLLNEQPQVIELEMQSEADDDTVSTRTEDDPLTLVNNAIRAAQVDEEDEEIVYEPPFASPVPISVVGSPAANPLISNVPSSSPITPPTRHVTAEDLLDNIMRRRSSIGESRPLPPTAAPLPPPTVRGLFPSGSPNGPSSIWSTTPQDSAVLSAANLYSSGTNRVSPPSMPAYSMSLNMSSTVSGAGGFSPGTPTRASSFGHQRNFSQPAAFGSTGLLDNQAIWPSQSSVSSSQALSQRYPLSSLTSSQQPLMGSRNGLGPISSSSSFSQLQQLQTQFQQQQHSPQASLSFGTMSHDQLNTGFTPAINGQNNPLATNTWSYSGLDSLNGLGAPLGPFSHQSQLQQPAQMHRSGAWMPT